MVIPPAARTQRERSKERVVRIEPLLLKARMDGATGDRPCRFSTGHRTLTKETALSAQELRPHERHSTLYRIRGAGAGTPALIRWQPSLRRKPPTTPGSDPSGEGSGRVRSIAPSGIAGALVEKGYKIDRGDGRNPRAVGPGAWAAPEAGSLGPRSGTRVGPGEVLEPPG